VWKYILPGVLRCRPCWCLISISQPDLSGTYLETRFGGAARQVTTRDESGQMTAHGVKQLPTGMIAPDGPPSTLGPSGRDWVAFLQGNVTRDATYFVNGTPVGARDIFQARARAQRRPFLPHPTLSSKAAMAR
jgi:hypothetical protein